MVDVFNEVGVGECMWCEGLVYYGIDLLFGGKCYCIDLMVMLGGCLIIVYGQYEVVKDLIVVCMEQGVLLLFDVSDVLVYDIELVMFLVQFVYDGVLQIL